jgi:hypothetical protein
MINTLQLWNLYRDTWGYYDASVNPMFAALDHNPCYRVREHEVPQVDLQVMNPGDYLQHILEIVPGSLIWGFKSDDTTPIYTLQITDVSTGHKFWDTPVSNIFIANAFGGYPSLLCSPYPVVGSGLFNVELWCDPNLAVPTRVGLIVGSAEVVECV